MRRAALDLALDRLRIDRAPDVLRRPDPHDARQAELHVHLGDDPHRCARVGDVRALAGDLARLRVEGRRAGVAVHAFHVDLAAGSLAFSEGRAACLADGAGGHPGHA